MKTLKKDKVYDSQTALACGEAFQRLARQFIPKISKIKEDSPKLMSKELSDVIACATNLTFAVELFIKALLIQLDLPMPMSHDLLKLYTKIPQSVRAIIEETYNVGLKLQLPRLQGHAITLSIGSLEAPVPQWDDYKVSLSLQKLLERTKNMFQTWRYYFEFSKPRGSPHQFHQFEYGPLYCAAEAIRIEVTVRLHGMVDTQGN